MDQVNKSTRFDNPINATLLGQFLRGLIPTYQEILGNRLLKDENGHIKKVDLLVDEDTANRLRGRHEEKNDVDQNQTPPPLDETLYRQLTKSALAKAGASFFQIQRIPVRIITYGKKEIEKIAKQSKDEIKNKKQVIAAVIPPSSPSRPEAVPGSEKLILLFDPQLDDERIKKYRTQLITRFDEMNKDEKDPGAGDEIWKEFVKIIKVQQQESGEETIIKVPETLKEAEEMDTNPEGSGQEEQRQAGGISGPSFQDIEKYLRGENPAPEEVAPVPEGGSGETVALETPTESTTTMIPKQMRNTEEVVVMPTITNEPPPIFSAPPTQLDQPPQIKRGGIIDSVNNFAGRFSRNASTSFANYVENKIQQSIIKQTLIQGLRNAFSGLVATVGANPVTVSLFIVIGVVFLITLLLVLNLSLLPGSISNNDVIPPTNTIEGLTLTKTGPSQVNPGESIRYEIKGEYIGTNMVILTDVIPENTTYSSSDGNYDTNSNSVIWEIKSGETFSHNLSVATKNIDYWVTNTVHANLKETEASPNDSNIPTNSNTCVGKLNPPYVLKSSLGNFGDPNCNYSIDDFDTQLQTEDPTHAVKWHLIAICESGAAPPSGANAYNPNSTSGKGGYGLFQMNPSGQGNGRYDAGNVNWTVQVSNAINYNKLINQSFNYWECARK